MDNSNTDLLPRCLTLLRELSEEMAVMRDALLRYDIGEIERQCSAQQSLCRELRTALGNSQAPAAARSSANRDSHRDSADGSRAASATAPDSALATQLRSAVEEVLRLNWQLAVLTASGLRALRVRSNLIMLAAPELADRGASRSFTGLAEMEEA